jgi:ABC-2 type transport system permease protein
VKKYLFMTRNSLMASMAYRTHYLFMLLGNIAYVVIVWFLWKAIYGDASSLNGMSFDSAFVYLSLAMSVFILMQCWTEWFMSNTIITGNIVINFIRPMDYQVQLFFDQFGFMVSNIITTLVPTWLVLVFVFGIPIPFGANVLLFALGLVLAFAISFCVDYLVGMLGFYTESIWGISMTKEVIVLLLSGALIPFAFFPEGIKAVLVWLPFQAIYNLPLRLLLEPGMGAGEALSIFGTQAAWVVALVLASRLAFSRTAKVLTVNGG